MDAPKPIKCISRSSVIVEGDLVVFDRLDLMHFRCWRTSPSEEQRREARQLIRASRDLLDSVPNPDQQRPDPTSRA